MEATTPYSSVHWLGRRLETEHNFLWAIALDHWLSQVVVHETLLRKGTASIEQLECFVREFRSRHWHALRPLQQAQPLEPVRTTTSSVQSNHGEEAATLRERLRDYFNLHSGQSVIRDALKGLVRVIDLHKLNLDQELLPTLGDLVACLPTPCFIILAASNLGDSGAAILAQHVIPRLATKSAYPAQWLPDRPVVAASTSTRSLQPQPEVPEMYDRAMSRSSFLLLRIMDYPYAPQLRPNLLLDLRCNGFSPEGFTSIAEAITQVAKKYSQGYLGGSSHNAGVSGVISLDLGNLPFAKTERLKPNLMGQKGAAALISLLKADSSLRSLGLGHVGTAGFDLLASSKPWKLPHCRLEELDVSSNRLPEATFTELLRALLPEDAGTQWDQYVTAYAADKGAKINLPRDQRQPKTDSERVQMGASTHRQRGIRRLNLSHNPFRSAPACEALCALIALSPTLTSLNLSHCGISPATHSNASLSSSLVACNASMGHHFVRLPHKRLAEAASRTLAESQSALESVSTYSFFTQFAAALTSTRSALRSLNLSGNPLTALGLGPIAAALPFSRIQVLNLKNCAVSLNPNPQANRLQAQRASSHGAESNTPAESSSPHHATEFVPGSRDTAWMDKQAHINSEEYVPISVGSTSHDIQNAAHANRLSSNASAYGGNAAASHSAGSHSSDPNSDGTSAMPWETLADYGRAATDHKSTPQAHVEAFQNFCFALMQSSNLSQLSLACNELGDLGATMIATALLHGPTNPLFAEVREVLEEQTLINAARSEALTALTYEPLNGGISVPDGAPNSRFAEADTGSALALLLERGPFSSLKPIHPYLQGSTPPNGFTLDVNSVFSKRLLEETPDTTKDVQQVSQRSDDEDLDVEAVLALARQSGSILSESSAMLSRFAGTQKAVQAFTNFLVGLVLGHDEVTDHDPSQLNEPGLLTNERDSSFNEPPCSTLHDPDILTLRAESGNEIVSFSPFTNGFLDRHEVGEEDNLTEGLPKFRSGITRLNLSQTGIGDMGAKAFTSLLIGRTTLQLLDLSSNFISTSVVEAWTVAKSLSVAASEARLQKHTLFNADIKFVRALLISELKRYAKVIISEVAREKSTVSSLSPAESSQFAAKMVAAITALPQLARFLLFSCEPSLNLAPALYNIQDQKSEWQCTAAKVHALSAMLGWYSLDEYLSLPVQVEIPKCSSQLSALVSFFRRVQDRVFVEHPEDGTKKDSQRPQNYAFAVFDPVSTTERTDYPVRSSPEACVRTELPITRARLAMERSRFFIRRLCTSRSNSELFSIKMVDLTFNSASANVINKFHTQFLESANRAELIRLRELRNGSELTLAAQSEYSVRLTEAIKRRECRLQKVLDEEKRIRQEYEDAARLAEEELAGLRRTLAEAQARKQELLNHLERIWDGANDEDSNHSQPLGEFDEAAGPLPAELQSLSLIERRLFVSLGPEPWNRLVSAARSLESSRTDHANDLTELRLKVTELERIKLEEDSTREQLLNELRDAETERAASVRVLADTVKTIESWCSWCIRSYVTIATLPRDMLAPKYREIRDAIDVYQLSLSLASGISNRLTHTPLSSRMTPAISPSSRPFVANSSQGPIFNLRQALDFSYNTLQSIASAEVSAQQQQQPSRDLRRLIYELAGSIQGMVRRYVINRCQRRTVLRRKAFHRYQYWASSPLVTSGDQTARKRKDEVGIQRPPTQRSMLSGNPFLRSLASENSPLVQAAVTSPVVYPPFVAALAAIAARAAGLQQVGALSHPPRSSAPFFALSDHALHDSASGSLDQAPTNSGQASPGSMSEASSTNGADDTGDPNANARFKNPLFGPNLGPVMAGVLRATSVAAMLPPPKRTNTQRALPQAGTAFAARSQLGLPTSILNMLNAAPEQNEMGAGAALYVNRNTLSNSFLSISLAVESSPQPEVSHLQTPRREFGNPRVRDAPHASKSHAQESNTASQLSQNQLLSPLEALFFSNQASGDHCRADSQTYLHMDWTPLDTALEALRRILVAAIVRDSVNDLRLDDLRILSPDATGGSNQSSEASQTATTTALPSPGPGASSGTTSSAVHSQELRHTTADHRHPVEARFNFANSATAVGQITALTNFVASACRDQHYVQKGVKNTMNSPLVPSLAAVDDFEDHAVLALLNKPQAFYFFINAVLVTMSGLLVAGMARPPGDIRTGSVAQQSQHVPNEIREKNSSPTPSVAIENVWKSYAQPPLPIVLPAILSTPIKPTLTRAERQLLLTERLEAHEIPTVTRFVGTQLRPGKTLISSVSTPGASHHANDSAKSLLRAASLCRPRPSQPITLFVDVVTSQEQLGHHIVMRVSDPSETDTLAEMPEFDRLLLTAPRVLAAAPVKLDLNLPLAVLFAQHRFITGGKLLVQFEDRPDAGQGSASVSDNSAASLFHSAWQSAYTVASTRDMVNLRRTISNLVEAGQRCMNVIAKRGNTVTSESLLDWDIHESGSSAAGEAADQSASQTPHPSVTKDRLAQLASPKLSRKPTQSKNDLERQRLAACSKLRQQTAQAIMSAPKAIPQRPTSLWPTGLAGRITLAMPKELGSSPASSLNLSTPANRSVVYGAYHETAMGWTGISKSSDQPSVPTLPPLPTSLQNPVSTSGVDSPPPAPRLTKPGFAPPPLNVSSELEDWLRPASQVLLPLIMARLSPPQHGDASAQMPTVKALYYLPPPHMAPATALDIAPPLELVTLAFQTDSSRHQLVAALQATPVIEEDPTNLDEGRVIECLTSGFALCLPTNSTSGQAVASLVHHSGVKVDTKATVGLSPTPTLLQLMPVSFFVKDQKPTRPVDLRPSNEIQSFNVLDPHLTKAGKLQDYNDFQQGLLGMLPASERDLVTQYIRSTITLSPATVWPALWTRLSGTTHSSKSESANTKINAAPVYNTVVYYVRPAAWANEAIHLFVPRFDKLWEQMQPSQQEQRSEDSRPDQVIADLGNSIRSLLVNTLSLAYFPVSSEADADAALDLARLLFTYSEDLKHSRVDSPELPEPFAESKASAPLQLRAFGSSPLLLHKKFPLLTSYTLVNMMFNESSNQVRLPKRPTTSEASSKGTSDGLDAISQSLTHHSLVLSPAHMFSAVEKTLSQLVLNEMRLQENILKLLCLPATLDLALRQKQREQELREKQREKEKREKVYSREKDKEKDKSREAVRTSRLTLMPERDRGIEPPPDASDSRESAVSQHPPSPRDSHRVPSGNKVQLGQSDVGATHSASESSTSDFELDDDDDASTDEDSAESEEDQDTAELREHGTNALKHAEDGVKKGPTDEKKSSTTDLRSLATARNKAVNAARQKAETMVAARREALLQADEEREKERARRLAQLAEERERKLQEARMRKAEREARYLERKQKLMEEAMQQEAKLASDLERNLRRAAARRQRRDAGSSEPGEAIDEDEDLAAERRRRQQEQRKREILSRRAAERREHDQPENTSDSETAKSRAPYSVVKPTSTSRSRSRHRGAEDVYGSDSDSDGSETKLERRLRQQAATERLYRTLTGRARDEQVARTDEGLRTKQQEEATKRAKAKKVQQAHASVQLSERSATSSAGPWIRLSMDLLSARSGKEPSSKSVDQATEPAKSSRKHGKTPDIVMLNALANANAGLLNRPRAVPINQEGSQAPLSSQLSAVERLYQAHMLPTDALAPHLSQQHATRDEVILRQILQQGSRSHEDAYATFEDDEQYNTEDIDVDNTQHQPDDAGGAALSMTSRTPESSNILDASSQNPLLSLGVTLLSKPPYENRSARLSHTLRRDDGKQRETSATASNQQRQALEMMRATLLQTGSGPKMQGLPLPAYLETLFKSIDSQRPERALNSRLDRIKSIADETALALLYMELEEAQARNYSISAQDTYASTAASRPMSESPNAMEKAAFPDHTTQDGLQQQQPPIANLAKESVDLSTPHELLEHVAQTRRYGRSFQQIERKAAHLDSWSMKHMAASQLLYESRSVGDAKPNKYL